MFFLCADTVNDVFRTKPRADRCSRSQRFLFSLSSFVSAYSGKNFAISSSILRFYLQIKSDLRPTHGNSVAVNATVSATLVGNSSFTCNRTVVLHERTLNVSNSTQNHYEEWNITKVLCDCWNISHGDDLLEVQINFTLPECNNSSSGRVPVQVVDPAVVPLSQKNRRAKYSQVQPMLVMYVDEDTADKSSMVEESPSRSRRSTPSRVTRFSSTIPSCQLANFTINFADLGLHQVLIPYSYNAHHCVGSCNPHVIDKVKNSTNHARLFASAAAKYVREPLKFKSPPKQPCCVPVEYDHIHLIEVHPDKSFSYKKYLDMSVTKCGCR